MMSAPLQSLAQGSMFWRPDHIEPSAWLDHLPWVFWLMEAMAPRRCVTLGARPGSPHSAFCQGVTRLNLDAECLLVADDEHGEAEAVHAAADRRYGSVARRLNVLPRRGAKQLPVDSIDILAVDFAPDDPDFDDTLDRWLSRMSDRGIVLIPGINRREPGCAAHEHFEALQVIYRSLTFLHGDGLGMLVIGAHPPDLIETLLERWSAPTAARTVRDVFARLGRGCADQALADVQRVRLKSMKQRVDELTQERDERDATLARLHLQIQEREDHLASLESEKQSLSDDFTESQLGQERTESALTETQTRLSSVESALYTSESQVSSLEAELANQEANVQTRFSELATLTTIAEEKDQAIQKLNLTVTELEYQVSEFERELTAARASLAETEQRRDRLEVENAELKRGERTIGSSSAAAPVATADDTRARELEAMVQERDESITTRFKELAILTQMLEERDREIAALKGESTDVEPIEAEADSPIATDSSAESLMNETLPRPGVRAATSASRWALGRFSFGTESDKRKERRRLRRKREEALAELEASEWFDSQWYLQQYPDIASDENYARFPALHYLKYGGFEGRDPSPYFDSAGYLEAYPDVAMTEINPLLHFIRDGINEGREPRP